MSAGATVSFALVLALSAVLAALVARKAKGGAKTYVDIASAVLACFALSVAVLPYAGGELSAALAPLAIAFAPSALTLAVHASLVAPPRAGIAAAFLIASALAGIGSAILGANVLAVSVLAANVVASIILGIVRLARRRRESIMVLASAFGLACGGSAFVAAGAEAVTLFLAASLMGVALAVGPVSRPRIENQRWSRRRLAIRIRR
jgi:hypothetical protein